MKLLVCIAAHYNPERIQFLEKVLETLSGYLCELDVIIDTNSPEFQCQHYGANIIGFVYDDLDHPFHLTQMHRQHFKREIDNYDWFLYLEDDMLLPWENFLSYVHRFEGLWNLGHVPSFVRIEQKGGEKYISDITEKQPDKSVWIHQKLYTTLPFPQNYHAFWIAPQWVLKQKINEDFTKLHDSREKAASYLIWGMRRKAAIEVERVNGALQIKETCFSYHLPNNYIDSSMPNAKIKLKEIFI